ncbi:hypothetical protein [Candidatus Ichthyocystis hellenicum]|nr:hypothetical protein [Candidatus Ichthyocystis hellenicum]
MGCSRGPEFTLGAERGFFPFPGVFSHFLSRFLFLSVRALGW